MKTATGPLIIERWENAARVLQALPAHVKRNHWDMGIWGNLTECGTIACAAGHCGLDPWFRRRGFTLNFDKKGNYDITDARSFFGGIGTEEIFYYQSDRPVSHVVREIKAHIKWLREPYGCDDSHTNADYEAQELNK